MVRLASAMKRRSPERGGSPVQQPSTPPGRTVTNPLLETSPQRRAFSFLLQMLHNANEAKCKCDEEKQRLVPKLLKLLKQARKEKYNMNQTYELALQKARRDILSSNTYWETTVDQLKKEHDREVRNLQQAVLDRDMECNRLREQAEKFMDEITTLEKILRTLQAEKEIENVKLKQILLDHEETILKVLQKQTDERNATMQHQWEQNEQLKASHAEQIRAMEERNAKSMQELQNKIMHATTLLLALQSHKDREEHQKQVQIIHNEFMSIANKLKLRTEEPTQYLQHCGETVEHYQMDLDEVPSPLPMMLSRGEETSESSLKSGTSQSDDARRQDSLENDHVTTIRALREKLESEKGRCDGLTERIRYMEQQSGETIELREHRQVTLQLEARSKALIEKIMELDAKLLENIGTMANLQADHTRALSQAAQELEAARHEILAEKAYNTQLRDIIEVQRNESSETRALLQTKTNEYEQAICVMKVDHSFEINTMQSHVEAASLQLATERSANSLLTEKNAALQTELEATQTTLTTKTEEYARATTQLRNELAAGKQLLTEITAENIQVKSQLDASNMEVATGKGANEELKHQISALQAELEEIQTTLLTRTEEHALATTQLMEELATSKERLSHAESESIQLQSKLDTSYQEVATLRSESTELKEQIFALQTELEELQTTLSITTEKHTQATGELGDKLAISKQLLTHFKTENVQLQSKLDSSNEEVATQISENTELKKKISALQTEFEELQTTLTTTTEKHAHAVGELTDKLAISKQLLTHVKTENVQLQSSLDASNQEVANQRSENTALKEKISGLHAELDEIQVTLTTTTERNSRAVEEQRNELRASMQLLAEIRAKNGPLQSLLDSTNQELDKERGAHTETRRKLAALQKELEETKASLTTTTEEHARATGQLKDELGTCKQVLSDMEAENGQLRSELDACNQELSAERIVNAEIHQTIAQVTRESEAIQGKLIKMTSEHDCVVAALREEVATSQQKLADTNMQCDDLRSALIALKREYDETCSVLRCQLTDLRFDMQIEQTKSQQLVEQLRDLSQENQEALERLRNDHSTLLEEKQNEIVRIQELCNMLRIEKQSLEDELSAQVMSTEAASDAEISVLKQYIKELETNIEECNSSLARAKWRQFDLIEQLRRFESHSKVLGPSSIEKGGRPPKKGKYSEEGKENNMFSLDQDRDVSASKQESSTPRRLTTSKEEEDDGSSSSGIIEIRRTLFAAHSPGEQGTQIVQYQGTPARSLQGIISERQLPVDMDLFCSPSAQQDSFDFDNSLEMEDWRERCYFLEHDRDELVRVTDRIIEHEKESHQLQLEAAVATVKREALQEQRRWENHTRQQMRCLYDALCSNCRHKIDTA